MGKDDSDDDTEALASTGVKLETPAKEAAPSGGQMSTEEREAREAKVEAERAAAQPTKLAGYNASHIGSRANLAHVRKESRANLNILPPTASKAVLGIDNPQAVGDAPATDQSLRDAAEIDNPDDTSIWEHTLVVEDEGKADFSALLKCPIAQKYDWSVEEGLSKGKAEEALAEFGENRLTPPEKLPEWIKFLLHLVGGFSLLLWGGAILCFVVYAINSAVDNLYLGIVLAVVVTATGIFSYMQEAKADATMEAFAKMAPEQVYCYRKGDQKIDEDREKMDATKLVPGDLVKVQLGDKVPADILMIRVDDFKVNNSALTGEPDPLERLTWCTDDDLMETKNVAFFGTFCEQGNCIGLVLRTGDQTRMGQIAADAADDDGSETLMQMEIRHFIHIVSACAGVLGIVFFIIAIPKYGIVDAFVFMIGIIVANVPEGLLATVTVALTLTAQTMATHQVLVKNMETIETLGSITTIASDKTGTLTQNRMAANHAVYDYQLKAVDAVMVAGEKKDMAFQANDPSFQALQRCATLCGSAKFCKYDEKMGEPKHWDSFSGKPGMGGKENQENDYQSFYHYVPYTKDDDEPVSFRTICDRIGWKVDNDVPFKAEAKDGEYMRWRNPDMAFRAYKDGNATDAGLMKFGEARVEDVYSTFADAADDEDVKRSLKSTVVKDSQGQETDVASYCEKYRKHWSQIAQIPFNSSNKFMVTVHNVPRQDTDVLQERQALLSTSNIEDDGEDYVVLMMKGAAERVADKCSTALFQGKPVDPKVYYGMLNGKMSTADDMTKAKNEEDRLQADQLSDEQKVLEKRKIFNFQTTIANSHEDDFVSNADVQTWTQKMDQIQDITGGSLVQGSPSSETATSLMKNPKSNTLKYHQQSLAVEGERVLAFAQLVAKKSDLISKGILIETGAAIEIDHERPEVEKALGFASADHDGAEYAWTYLGMVSLVDPPRDAVPAAVESCRTASIQVVMVTGDHPLTAKSIATRIKIIQGDTWREFERGERIAQGKDPDLITEKEMFESYSHHEWFGLQPRYKKVKGCAVFGPTIHNFTDDDWRYTLRLKELVFARTQPEQKKEIVGKMKNLHELNLDALDQLHACKQLLQSKRDLVEIRTKLGEHFTSIEEQTDKKKKEHREKCVKAGKKTSGSDYNDDMDKIDEEGKQDKKKVAQAYLDTSDHDFRMATFLMLPVRAKELHDKLQGDSTADSLIQEIDALVDRETNRNNQPKVVAVTGDGVNDSPALKAADCGIAMGIAGADVAKENADMILLDDNFASIVQGIEQGRLIFDNLKKSIAYTLTSNIPEITPFLALIIFQIPIPLETVMILCIDLGTDMLPAISLAYEEPEGGIMKRAPRDKSCDRLVNSKLIFMAYGQIGMIQAAAGFACYFLVFDHYGLSYDDIVNTGFDYKDDGVATVAGLNYDTRVDILRKAQTSFLVSIVVAQWADVIICKTRERTIFEQGMTNMVLNVGILEETILAIVLVYCPPLHDAFYTTDIDFKMWCYGMPFSFLIWIYDEARKWAIRTERKNNPDWPENKGIVERWTYY